MATYTIHVKVDDEWVKRWHGKKSLCFSTGVTGGAGEKYNVVAASELNFAGLNQFSWTDSFQIAASHQKLQGGVEVTSSTDIVPIAFRQTYELKENWAHADAHKDADAPANGFRFTIPLKQLASAVVYKSVSGSFSPVYISQDGPLPQGNEDLIPIAKARVWFESDTKTAHMIDKYRSVYAEIDLTTKQERTVSFTKDGSWVVED